MLNKTRLAAFFWIFFLFLLQNTASLAGFRQSPPLLLIGVLFYALYEGPVFGLVLGCYAGFFIEIMGSGSVGYQMAILGAVGILGGHTAAKIFREGILAKTLLPVICFYFAVLLNLFLIKKTFHEEAGLGPLLAEAFLPGSLILTVFLSPLLFAFLKRFSFIADDRSASF